MVLASVGIFGTHTGFHIKPDQGILDFGNEPTVYCAGDYQQETFPECDLSPSAHLDGH